MKLSSQRIGEIMIIGQSILFGLFPIVTHYATGFIPPILFASLSMLIASVVLLIFSLADGSFAKISSWKVFPSLVAITFFIVIIPAPLLFIGAKLTSSINTAILLKSELVFAILLSFILSQGFRLPKLVSGLMILAGALIILVDGSFEFQKGDLLILLASFFYPIGNSIVQKTFALISASGILFFRSFFGGITLFMMSIVFENSTPVVASVLQDHFWLLLLNGVFLWAISKMMVYEGLRRLDLVKATSLMMTETAFSLIYAMVFLSEIPTIYQLLGFVVVMIGVYFSTKPEYVKKALQQATGG